MEKQPILITVSGSVGSGKTRIAYLLQKFLQTQGLETEYECELKPHEIEPTLTKTISAIAEKRKIIIKEHQVHKNYGIDALEIVHKKTQDELSKR